MHSNLLISYFCFFIILNFNFKLNFNIASYMSNSFLSNLAIFTIGVYVGQEYKNTINIKECSIKILHIIKQTDFYKEIIKK